MSRGRSVSVRMRTAIAASVAVAVALLIVSVAGVVHQRHQLIDGVAVVAQDQAETVAAAMADGAAPDSAVQTPAGGESVLIQVLDADGTVLAASHSLEGEPALVDAAGVTEPTRHVLSGLDGEEDRYLVVVAPASDGRSVLAAQSLETVDNATRSTIGLLAVGDPLLVLLVALLTYVLVGRALRPVESLRAQAAEVTAADLSARLPVPTTGDEVERLSVTLNEMLARLERSADAQRRFVADASHELRSPVATIRTLHEVADAAGDRADWPAVSADVLSETARLERLVADLLLLARSGSTAPPSYELLDLSEVVRAEAGRARRVAVTCDVAPDVLVLGNPDALARATRNLLDNAERHTHTLLEVTLTSTGTTAHLRVRDDGDGVPAADRERIFDRFVRLDEARARDDGGTGLGLAITRLLVQEHGGAIRLDDTGSPGAEFVIDLPRVSPDA
ncbi:hypothetical protein ASC77_21410 [Nocardioides sp. Root1257]|uniref:sensor histidine kinase n=1 Tax=unclassified Nocardioides TaxID=2615069 RepID=UPI0006F8424F|nr:MULTISPECIES: HAMP domain-containing sensor histidine kinase [unclassified Nocardioides]KQW43955.1 hypothetical protein ASC77_21410 [Nocardioides sp. Root1257]